MNLAFWGDAMDGLGQRFGGQGGGDGVNDGVGERGQPEGPFPIEVGEHLHLEGAHGAFVVVEQDVLTGCGIHISDCRGKRGGVI